MGKMVLIQVIEELEMQGKLGNDVNRADVLDTLKAFHGTFGEAVLKQWKFPEEFLLTARHHDSMEDVESITKELMVVHLANLIVKQMGPVSGQLAEKEPAFSVSAIMLKMDADQIAQVKEEVARRVAETKTALFE